MTRNYWKEKAEKRPSILKAVSKPKQFQADIVAAVNILMWRFEEQLAQQVFAVKNGLPLPPEPKGIAPWLHYNAVFEKGKMWVVFWDSNQDFNIAHANGLTMCIDAIDLILEAGLSNVRQIQ